MTYTDVIAHVAVYISVVVYDTFKNSYVNIFSSNNAPPTIYISLDVTHVDRGKQTKMAHLVSMVGAQHILTHSGLGWSPMVETIP